MKPIWWLVIWILSLNNRAKVTVHPKKRISILHERFTAHPCGVRVCVCVCACVRVNRGSSRGREKEFQADSPLNPEPHAKLNLRP